MIKKLYKADVAAKLGWVSPNHVSVALHRTRRHAARVAFPAPDGYDLIEHPVNKHREEPYWLSTTIDAYIEALRVAGGRPVPPELVGRMRKMYEIDGYTMEEIGVRLGVSKATVSRRLARVRPPTAEGK